MSFNDIIAGDYGQTIVLTVLDTDTETAADVSAYTTAIQVWLKDPDGNVESKTGAFVSDGSDGQVSYTLADGDIDAEGQWGVRARVASGSAVLSSKWHYFDVKPKN